MGLPSPLPLSFPSLARAGTGGRALVPMFPALGQRLAGLALALLVAALGGTCCAARAADIGDPAPPLQTSAWLQGEIPPEKPGDTKRIYVVDFWSTWARTMPEHVAFMNGLHEAYNGTNVLVVSITAQPQQSVRHWLGLAKLRIAYSVAIDRERGSSDAYLAKLGIKTLPYTFVIDTEGRIAWHGIAGEPLAVVLRQMLEGKYDIKEARARSRAARVAGQLGELLRDPARKARGIEVAQRLLTHAKDEPMVLNEIAWALLNGYQVGAQDAELALMAAEGAIKASPTSSPAMFDTQAKALLALARPAEAVAVARKALDLCKSDEERALVRPTLEASEKAIKAAPATAPATPSTNTPAPAPPPVPAPTQKPTPPPATPPVQ